MAKTAQERRGIGAGPILMAQPKLQELIIHPVANLLATDGVQISAVATVGTTAVEVFTKLIDPGMDMRLLELEVGLTGRFDNLIANSVGSIAYYWRARRNIQGTQHAWLGLMATQGIGVATGGATGDPKDDTFSGYVPVGSLADAPFDLSLMAVAIVASSMLVSVKNSSYIKLIGAVIPGT